MQEETRKPGRPPKEDGKLKEPLVEVRVNLLMVDPRKNISNQIKEKLDTASEGKPNYIPVRNILSELLSSHDAILHPGDVVNMPRSMAKEWSLKKVKQYNPIGGEIDIDAYHKNGQHGSEPVIESYVTILK